MGESKLKVEERQAGDVTVLVLSGEMLLDDGDLVFRKLIHEQLEKGHVKILVDLAGVTYIDSSGVGMMAAKLKTV
jgi:anti-sigma B factor antagonist